jgi:hypothetical protein
MLGDKAHDSAELREELDEQGTKPVIPNRSNRKQPFRFSKGLYKLRWRIEAAFNRLEASGGSFAVRRLYTDDEEVLFKAARPIVLNGIDDVIGRADLADRAIFLSLTPIREEQRRPETELWREFERARPGILSALLDAVAHGLRAVNSVHHGQLPRMADFALWATACEPALWPAGTFSHAYAENRKSAIESIIDAAPITAFVRELMSGRNS